MLLLVGMSDMLLAIFVLSSFVLLIGFAAVHDVLTLMIPNWVSIVLACIFPIAALIYGLGWAHVGIGIGIGLMVMVVGAVLYALNAIGGGDVKLIAATSVWYGTSTMSFLLLTAIAGGVLALIWLCMRRLRLHVKLLNHLSESAGIPYGVAIASGGLLAARHSEILQTSLIVLDLS